MAFLWHCYLNAATYYVATNGTAGGTGAIGSPWDLQTALSKNTLVGDDLVWIRGGVYTHAPQDVSSVPCCNEGEIFHATISGTVGHPIIFRGYPRERASIDGGAFGAGAFAYHANARPTLLVGGTSAPTTGKYLRFQDLEIFSSSTEARFSGADSSFPTDISRSDGFYAYGIGVELINCIIHNVTAGISSFPGGQGNQGYDQIYYGNLTYNNGWKGTPNNHGHGFYMQNFPNLGIKTVKRNIAVGNYDKNMQIYGSGSSKISNFRVSENVNIGWAGVRGNTLIGTRTGAANRMIDDQFINNFGYGSSLQIYEQPDADSYVDLILTGNYYVDCFFQASSWQTAIITNNWFISPGLTKVVSLWTNSTIIPWTYDYNHYVVSNTVSYQAFRIETHGPTSFAQWTNDTHYDIHSTVTTASPSGTNYIIVQSNLYDSTRATVIVYNWTASTATTADISILGWSPGDVVLVHNVQDYYTDAPAQAVGGGLTLTLNMQAGSHTVAVPFGDTVPTVPNTFPRFGAFILENLGGGSAPPPILEANLSVTSSTPNSGVSIQMSPADIDGLSNGTTPFTRTVVSNSVVTLTAPLASVDGNVFAAWMRQGVSYTTSLIATFTNSTDLTMSAVYAVPTPVPTAGGSTKGSASRRGLRY